MAEPINIPLTDPSQALPDPVEVGMVGRVLAVQQIEELQQAPLMEAHRGSLRPTDGGRRRMGLSSRQSSQSSMITSSCAPSERFSSSAACRSARLKDLRMCT